MCWQGMPLSFPRPTTAPIGDVRTYRVELRPSASKQLEKLTPPDRPRVLRRIKALEVDPRPPGCQKLAGEDDLWRVRAGDYRIVYEIIDERLIVTVVRIGHRSDVYRH